MSLFSDPDVASLREILELSLPDTAVIQASSFSDDGGGGGTIAFTAAGTVACRLSPITGSERLIAERISEESTDVITLPAGTTVTQGGRIVVGSTSYEVKAVRAPRSWEVSRRVEVTEVA